VKNADLFICPASESEAGRHRTQHGEGFDWWDHIPEPDPEHPEERGVTSYCYNYVRAGGDWCWFGPSRKTQFFPGVFPDLERHSAGQAGGESKAILSEATASINPPPNAPTPKGWHGDGGNVLYLDGHAVWVDGPSMRQAIRQGMSNVPAQPKDEFNVPVHQNERAAEIRSLLKALDRVAGG
jgi:prepilin-type processing-associated H-X9-DG protein